MNISSKKASLVFFLMLIVFQSAFALGAADNIAKAALRQTDNVTRRSLRNVDNVIRHSGRYADNLARLGWRHSDDAIRVSTLHAGDLARLSTRHGDNFARLGLQEGDDLIRGSSQIRRNLPRREHENIFRNTYGAEALTDVKAITGGQNQHLQAVARGEVINPKSQQRVSRLNNLLDKNRTSEAMTFPRGENMSREGLSNFFETGTLEGKNLNEIADLLKGKNTYNTGFTSASLPTTPRVEVNDWAIHGLHGRQNNNIKIIRELHTPAGTSGMNVSQVAFYGHDEFIFKTGLKTRVDDAIVERIFDREGNIYEIIRIFETVIP